MVEEDFSWRPPVIKGIEHVALSVSDLERSIAFYRDLIGLDLLRIIEAPPERGLGRIVGLPGCSARIAHLVSGTFMLELFEYRRPRGRSIPPEHSQADHGFSHIGLVSSDLAADAARLRAAGARLFGEPVEFRPGVWVVYFHGPDGEVCELRQTPDGDSRA
jgi:catechol 2,3-dioxygenase-like lactoylglutathione lyase family enzyme